MFGTYMPHSTTFYCGIQGEVANVRDRLDSSCIKTQEDTGDTMDTSDVHHATA